MQTRWRIQLLGGLRVEREGEVITRFRTRKAGLLLACLAYDLERAHRREELIERIWPEESLETGRNGLRTSLYALRTQLEPRGASNGSVLRADRVTVQLDPDAVTTDVAEFEAALQWAQQTGTEARQREGLARAVELYRGELLPGYDADWVLLERQWLAERYFQALSDLLAQLERAGDLEGALAYARSGVRADPLREEAHRDLIRLLAVEQPAAALRHYEDLERVLARDLGDEPSADLRALAAALRAQLSPTSIPMPVERSIPLAPSTPISILPLPLDRFFGRRSELARLIALLSPRTAAAAGDEDRFDESAPPRLVTLTGPGGSGKTRLALEVARRLHPRCPFPICFVPLQGLTPSASPSPGAAPVRPPILEEVRDALRLPRTPGADPLEQVVTALAQQATLLILDNFEHLVEGGAPLIQALLQRVATLTILVASRRRLNLPGEWEFPVLPLPVPEQALGSGLWALGSESPRTEAPGHSSGSRPRAQSSEPRAVLSFPSVQLFVDRARQARADFQLTPTNAADVARLCARLEGIPLAIELAAGRAGVLTPGQILERLSRPFALLVNRRSGVEERHRSLRATLDWSCQLLSPELQQFFARLSVFRGGWTLEAAEAMCSGLLIDDCRLMIGDGGSALDYMEQLRECSLILAEEASLSTQSAISNQQSAIPEMRYRLLETLREYGAERLTEGEAMVLARRHAVFFLALAERAEPWMKSPERYSWLAQLEAELDNFRAALAWCLDRLPGVAPVPVAEWDDGDPKRSTGNREITPAPVLVERRASSDERSIPSPLDTGLRLATALAEFWAHTGHAGEGRAWLERFLERANGLGWTSRAASGSRSASERTAGFVRAKALAAAGYLAGCQYDVGSGRLLEESIALWRELEHPAGLVEPLCRLGLGKVYAGKFAAARALLEECVALARELGDRWTLAAAVDNLGRLAQFEGELSAARALLEEARSLCPAAGAEEIMASILYRLGCVAENEGHLEEARELYEQSMATESALPAADYSCALRELGRVARLRGDYAEARARLEEGRALRQRLGHVTTMPEALFLLADLALGQGDFVRANALASQSLALARARQHPYFVFRALQLLGCVAHQQGEPQEARKLLDEAMLHAPEYGRALVSIDLAELLAGLGERAQSQALFAKSLAALRGFRDRLGVSQLLRRQGRVELRHGQWRQASAAFRESLSLLQEWGVREGVPDCLEGVAAVVLAASLGEPDRPADGQPMTDATVPPPPRPSDCPAATLLAARLLGAAEAMREAMGAPLPPVYEPDHEHTVAGLRTALGEQELAVQRAEGRAMSPEAAVEAALAPLSPVQNATL